MAARVVAAALFLVLATPAVVYAAQHVVGDSSGWESGVDYTTWASQQTFTVGDTIVFNYGSTHGVDVVSKDDYNNCNTANPLESHSDGKTNIKLSKAGTMYFVCSNSFHCSSGMRLAVDVEAASGSPGGSPPSASTPTTPSTPETPETPSSSTTPSTPSTSSPDTKNDSNTPNGATGGFGSINHLMLGVSLVLAALFVRV